jgi:hypothetical protein
MHYLNSLKVQKTTNDECDTRRIEERTTPNTNKDTDTEELSKQAHNDIEKSSQNTNAYTHKPKTKSLEREENQKKTILCFPIVLYLLVR